MGASTPYHGFPGFRTSMPPLLAFTISLCFPNSLLNSDKSPLVISPRSQRSGQTDCICGMERSGGMTDTRFFPGFFGIILEKITNLSVEIAAGGLGGPLLV